MPLMPVCATRASRHADDAARHIIRYDCRADAAAPPFNSLSFAHNDADCLALFRCAAAMLARAWRGVQRAFEVAGMQRR